MHLSIISYIINEIRQFAKLYFSNPIKAIVHGAQILKG